MRSVAKGLCPGMLASAPGDDPFFLDFRYNRGEFGDCVGAVTEWLILRSPASAPGIGPGFHIQHEGALLSDFGF